MWSVRPFTEYLRFISFYTKHFFLFPDRTIFIDEICKDTEENNGKRLWSQEENCCYVAHLWQLFKNGYKHANRNKRQKRNIINNNSSSSSSNTNNNNINNYYNNKKLKQQQFEFYVSVVIWSNLQQFKCVCTVETTFLEP